MENIIDFKEIAAYLPYKVKCMCPTGYRGGADAIRTIIAVGETYITFRNTALMCVDVNFYKIKLILFPLDCLTKEIEVNGEKFVPIDFIYKIWFEKGLFDFSKSILKNKICLYTESMPYWLVQLLLEWKFDIFGLIERCLAIAVTEEFNPYK